MNNKAVTINVEVSDLMPEEIAILEKGVDATIDFINMVREARLLRLLELCHTPCWRYRA